jgi:hypothetical protein
MLDVAGKASSGKKHVGPPRLGSRLIVRRFLSHAIVNFGDLLHQDVPNLVRAAHPIGHQAHIGWAHSEILGHTGVQAQVQFMDVKKVFFVQFTLRFFCISPHAPPPAAVPRSLKAYVYPTECNFVGQTPAVM